MKRVEIKSQAGTPGISELSFPHWVYTILFLPVWVYFRFVGGTWLIISNEYHSRVLNLVFISLIFLIWLIWKFFIDKKLVITGLEAFIGLFIGSLFLSVIYSDNKILSLDITVGIVGILLSVYILLDIKRYPEIWKSLLDAMIIAGGMNLILIMIRVIFWLSLYDIKIKDIFTSAGYAINVLPRLPDIVNFNANVTAVYLIILIPISIYRLASIKNLILKASLGLGISFAVIILFLTKSRGVFIGLLFSMAGLWISNRNSKNDKLRGNKFLVSIAAAFGLACAVIFGIYVFRYRGPLFGASLIGRFEGWQIAWEIIKSNPIFGSGLGTYGEVFLNLRNPELYSLINLHAHNELLNILTNLGLVGTGLVLLLLYKYGKNYFSDSVDLNWERRAYIISLLGFLGMGLVDSFFDSNNIVLMILVLLIGLIPVHKLKTIDLTGRLAIAVMVVVVGLAGYDMISLWKLQPYGQARDAAGKGDWQLAEKYLDTALLRNEKNAFYLYSRAQVIGQNACIQNRVDQGVIDNYYQNIGIFDRWGPAHANLSGLYAAVGSFGEAQEQIINAISYEPRNAEYLCLLGDYQVQQNQLENAIISYGQCLMMDASLMDTHYWKKDQNKAQAQDQVLKWITENQNNSQTSASINIAEIYIDLGKFDEAEAILSGILDQELSNLDAVLIYADLLGKTNRHGIAIDLLDDVLSIKPRFYRGWTQISKIYYEIGMMEEGLRAVDKSIAISPGPTAFWISGNILLKLDLVDEAMERYEIALAWRDNPPVLTQWTVRRFPIPNERISCLPDLRTYTEFYDLAWTAVNELCLSGHCDKAQELLAVISSKEYAGFLEDYGSVPSLEN